MHMTSVNKAQIYRYVTQSNTKQSPYRKTHIRLVQHASDTLICLHNITLFEFALTLLLTFLCSTVLEIPLKKSRSTSKTPYTSTPYTSMKQMHS